VTTQRCGSPRGGKLKNRTMGSGLAMTHFN
jgi:hypothetical protein